MRRPIPHQTIKEILSDRPNSGLGIFLPKLRDYLFADPRYSQERVFLCIWVPLLVVPLAGAAILRSRSSRSDHDLRRRKTGETRWPIPDQTIKRRLSDQPNSGLGKFLPKLPDYLFADPRYSWERVFLYIWAPLLVVALAGTAIWIYASGTGKAERKRGPASPPAAAVPNDPATAWWTGTKPVTRSPAIVLSDEGTAALRDKNLPLAESKFRESLKIDPRSTDAWSDLAATLMLQGRHAEALEALDSSLSLDPRNPRAHANRSLALRALGRFDEAVSAATAALGLDPSNPLLSNRLLLLKIQSGDVAGVRRELKANAGMASLEAGQIMAVAALAASDGNMKLCLSKLERASHLLSQATRRTLLADPVFAPYIGKILAASEGRQPAKQ